MAGAFFKPGEIEVHSRDLTILVAWFPKIVVFAFFWLSFVEIALAGAFFKPGEIEVLGS